MRFFVLMLLCLSFAQTAFSRNVTQYFSGTAYTQSGGVYTSYGAVQGTLIVASNFTQTGTNGPCESAYFNVGGEYTYSGTATMTVQGLQLSATDSGATVYSACDNSREISFPDGEALQGRAGKGGSYFAVECWPYAADLIKAHPASAPRPTAASAPAAGNTVRPRPVD